MLHILGLGHAHPANLVTNSFLESLETGTSAEWIREKIGIETRFTTLPLGYIQQTRNQDPREATRVTTMTSTDLGVRAAQMALERAGVSADQVGLLIVNCCNPRETTPPESQRIADVLGISSPAYDVFSACPAFALHLDYLNRFEDEALPEFVLCISTATLTHKVNYNDRTDGAIWGDGAAAWVVSGVLKGRLAVTDTLYASDPTRCDAVVVESYSYFHQDGRAVRDFSVRQTVRLLKALVPKHNLDWNSDIFIGHQANATMLQQITSNRGIPATNHWSNAATHGNQAGAGAPAVLSMHWDKVEKDKRLVVAVVGAGLSWGTLLMVGQ